MYVTYVNAHYVFDTGGTCFYYCAMDEPNSERIITPMPKSLVLAINDFRFAQRIESRAEAIRQLIERGLETAKARPTE